MSPEELIAEAVEARRSSYSPYSGYAVGAALLADDGRVFLGTNVENASFGLTVCAERSAFFRAIQDGCRNFRALAVVTADGASMCGACRQVAREFSPGLKVYLADEEGNHRCTTLAYLLPDSFGPDRLDPNSSS